MRQDLILRPGISEWKLRTGIIIRQLRNPHRFFDRRIMVPETPKVKMQKMGKMGVKSLVLKINSRLKI
jgi:hypothetical protein